MGEPLLDELEVSLAENLLNFAEPMVKFQHFLIGLWSLSISGNQRDYVDGLDFLLESEVWLRYLDELRVLA